MENVCIEWSDLSKIHNIDNNKKNLSSVFEESVKSCIFDKYDKIKLDTKDSALYGFHALVKFRAHLGAVI